MARRPLPVTLVAWLYIAAGTAGLVYHASQFGTGDRLDEGVILLVRVLAIVGGIFALRGAGWSRWLLLGWAAFHVIVSLNSMSKALAHVVLLVVVAYIVLRPPGSSWFRHDPATGS